MEKAKQSTKKVFFSGVLLLSVSTMLVKVLGLIYKIPMLSYLGSEGMGYFHSAYELYALFCIIATAGLPVALSVLVSEALARGETNAVGRIYRAAMAVFLALGTLGTLIMLVLADRFCAWIKSDNAYTCVISIAPTLFFVCVSSAVRGYFQGHQRMLPTALSQLIEAVGKLAFGLLFARIALERGAATPQVAAAAGWGLTLGSAVATLYLLIEKARCRETAPMRTEPAPRIPYRRVWRRLARLAIPMTLGASLVSLTKLIDMAMILRRLQAIGYTEALANEAYGSYTTLALSVYGLLPTLLNSVFLPLVPMLTSAIAAGDREKQTQMVETSYRLTAFFALPASLAISAFAHPVLTLLFHGETDAIAIAAPLLSMLGGSVFLSCMISASNSVLHAYQVVNRPILSLVAGALVKIAVAYVLIGLPSVGLMGAPVSTLLCNATVVLMNLAFASRLCNRLSLKEIFFTPLWISCVAVGVPFGLYLFFTAQFGFSMLTSVVCMLLAVLLYAVLFFACGAVSREDLCALPMGERLCGVLVRLKLLEK
ncbi:MAG: polysaccharide biosynthesis protein [Clostridia bacterium]|nr:polysaccharide biosynthesis protein [Clostridia bacterium]